MGEDLALKTEDSDVKIAIVKPSGLISNFRVSLVWSCSLMRTTACFTMAIASSLLAHSAATLDPRASAAINDATDSEVDVRGIMIFSSRF